MGNKFDFLQLSPSESYFVSKYKIRFRGLTIIKESRNTPCSRVQRGLIIQKQGYKQIKEHSILVYQFCHRARKGSIPGKRFGPFLIRSTISLIQGGGDGIKSFSTIRAPGALELCKQSTIVLSIKTIQKRTQAQVSERDRSKSSKANITRKTENSVIAPYPQSTSD